MTFLSETRERFLHAITAKIPPERLIEIYFFAPIRQGGIESGVAVIAAESDRPAPGELEDALPDGAASQAGAAAGPTAEPDEVPPGDALIVADSADPAPACDLDAAPAPDETIAGDVIGVDDTASDELVVQQEVFVEPAAGGAARGARRTAAPELASPAPRYTVYMAKYRLVLKGIDRGKWETAVVAEADAPLLTVETVVRGVQRRSGDTEEPERMSGEDARGAVKERV